MKKRSGLWILLIFPVLGLVGMILVLVNSRGDSTEETANQMPTPAPLITTPLPTPRPTVTPKPILDAPAPDNILTTLEGDTFTLADLNGQTVIVNFWATWCPPCVREMPTLQQFAETHPEVTILAVTDPLDGQTLDDIKAFLDEYNLTEIDIGLDENGMLRLNFNTYNLPMTFVLDENGIVRFRQIGEVTEDDLNYYVSELSAS